MRILRNYFLKEFFAPLALSLGVITFVMVFVGNLKKIADLVINKGVDLFSVAKLFLFLMPYIVTYALPISILIAVLMALGRLSSDNEVMAIRSSGINIFSLILPFLTLGLILSLMLVIFNDRASSYAHYAYRKTLIEIGIKNPTAAFEEGVFINSFDKYVLFVYRVDQKKNKLYNVRIYEPQGENKPTRTIVAKSGEFIAVPEKNIIKLKLVDGTSDEPDPENPTNFYKLNFKSYFMNLSLASAKNRQGKIEKKTKEMTIRELNEEIAKLKKEGISTAPLVTEINEKLALAFSCFVFMLLGSSVGIVTHRKEKSINLGLAILIIVIYYPLLIGSEALGIQGYIDPALAMWLPNIILGLAGTFLTIRLCVY